MCAGYKSSTDISNDELSYSKRCIPKCCPENEALYTSKEMSRKSLFNIPIFSCENYTLVRNVSKSELCYTYEFKSSDDRIFAIESKFYMQENELPLHDSIKKSYLSEYFCVDTVANEYMVFATIGLYFPIGSDFFFLALF